MPPLYCHLLRMRFDCVNVTLLVSRFPASTDSEVDEALGAPLFTRPLDPEAPKKHLPPCILPGQQLLPPDLARLYDRSPPTNFPGSLYAPRFPPRRSIMDNELAVFPYLLTFRLFLYIFLWSFSWRIPAARRIQASLTISSRACFHL